MKKMMAIMMLVVVSFVAVGCGKSDGKKAANEINALGDEANALAEAGAKEYMDAKYYADDINVMSRSELVALHDKFSSAKSNLTTAKAKYQQALNVESKNKDSVKVYGKESVYEAMKNIDIIVADIDKMLSKIESRMKKKAA